MLDPKQTRLGRPILTFLKRTKIVQMQHRREAEAKHAHLVQFLVVVGNHEIR